MLVVSFDSNFLYTQFAQVYEFVGLTELYYAGSHGMDIIGPVRQSVSDNHANCIRSTDNQVLGLKVLIWHVVLNLSLPLVFFLKCLSKGPLLCSLENSGQGS